MGNFFKRPTFTREITGIERTPDVNLPGIPNQFPMDATVSGPPLDFGPPSTIPGQFQPTSRTESFKGTAPALAFLADFMTGFGGPQGFGSGIPYAQQQQQRRNAAPGLFFEQQQQQADLGTQRTLQMHGLQRQEQQDRFKFVDFNGRKTLVDTSRLADVQAGKIPPEGAFITLEPDKLTPENVARETAKALKQFGIDEKQLTPEDRGTIHYGILEALRTGDYTPAQQAMNAVAGRHKDQQPRPAKVEYNQGIPVSVTDTKGVSYDINDPQLPAPLKSLVSSAQAAHKQRVQESADVAELAAARADARQEKSLAAAEEARNRPTSTSRATAEFATTLLPHIDEAKQMVNDLDKRGKLGPILGRWNEFMAGTVGAGDEDYATFRMTMNLLKTGLMRIHVGARGGVQLLAKFDKLLAEGKMDKATLNGALTAYESFAKGYAELGQAVGKKTIETKSKAAQKEADAYLSRKP